MARIENILFKDKNIKKLVALSKIDLGKIDYHDQNIIDYMCKPNDFDYYLPNLTNCLKHNVIRIYDLINSFNPQNEFDIRRIITINFDQFKSFIKLKNNINSCGLAETILLKEELVEKLINYEIDKISAEQILSDIGHLKEWEIILIESSDLNNNEKNEIYNIKKLISLEDSNNLFLKIYTYAFFKFYFNDLFNEVIRQKNNSYIGLFFFINNKIVPSLSRVDFFDVNVRMFNKELSHFDMFNNLNIDGEYSEYPRGRVIFDNFKKRFLVYIDKSLNTKQIKELIIDTFNLKNEKVRFLFDEHYKHYD